jgi:hypothetical protein
VDVLKVAMPPLRVAVPNTVVRFWNVTVPVGVPLAELTVAVNVTAWPDVEGLGEEVSVVVLAIFFTTWLKFGEVLVAKVASPLYTALIKYEPAASAEVVKVAVPPLIGAVPSTVVDLRNVIVPVGVPLEDVTVAVKVTDWPTFDGFKLELTAVVVPNLFTFWVTV